MKIIITGASRGIGYATALQLAQEGHQVLALSRNEKKLASLKEKAPDGGLDILQLDLREIDVEKLIQKVETLGGVDILINNAGHLINKSFGKLEKADWLAAFEVNVFGPVQLIQQLLPWLKASENAHILNISSMGGFQGSSKFPGLVAYSSSKGAISNITECLAEEFKEDKIKVNCLALGAVQTEMLESAFPGYQAPLTADEMGAFISYFATKGHHFFNGKVLPVSLSTP